MTEFQKHGYVVKNGILSVEVWGEVRATGNDSRDAGHRPVQRTHAADPDRLTATMDHDVSAKIKSPFGAYVAFPLLTDLAPGISIGSPPDTDRRQDGCEVVL